MLGDRARQMPDLKWRLARFLRRCKQRCRWKFCGECSDRRLSCNLVQAVDRNCQCSLGEHCAQQTGIFERQSAFRQDTQYTTDNPIRGLACFKRCFGETTCLDRDEYISVAFKDSKSCVASSAKMDLTQMCEK